MKRTLALALGTCLLALPGLVLGQTARAGSKTKNAEEKTTVEERDGKTVEKRVIVQRAGGSAFLGVGLADVEGEARGAKVSSVEKDSAAAKAGLEEGDVIVRFDGEPVRSAAQLSRLVAETPAGRSVAVEVSRGGAVHKLTATLGERRMRTFDGSDFPGMGSFRFELPVPPAAPEAPHAAPMPPLAPRAWGKRRSGENMFFRMFPDGGPRKLGVEYIDMGEQLAAAYKLSQKDGVLVTAVDADSPAAKAGVKAGDVILKLDGKAIKDGSDLRDAVAAAEPGKDVTITIQRDGRPLDLKATLARPEPKPRLGSGETL